MIVKQSALGDGQLTAHGCGQVAIANLLGLPFETVRSAFDQAGSKAQGRRYGTNSLVVQTMLGKLGHPATHQFLSRARKARPEDLEGSGILLVRTWGGYHYVAFSNGVVQDSDSFGDLKSLKRSIKCILKIQEVK